MLHLGSKGFFAGLAPLVLVLACSGSALDGSEDDPKPEQGGGGARASQGRAGSTQTSESAGTGDGGSGGCHFVQHGGKASVSVPVRWVGAEPPLGAYRACRHDECFDGINAGMSIQRDGQAVSVGIAAGTLVLDWIFPGYATGDRYQLAFVPAGTSPETPIFDTNVSYDVYGPDVPGACDVYTSGYRALTDEVDLTPGATGEGGAGGADSTIVDGGEGGTSGAAGS